MKIQILATGRPLKNSKDTADTKNMLLIYMQWDAKTDVNELLP